MNHTFQQGLWKIEKNEAVPLKFSGKFLKLKKDLLFKETNDNMLLQNDRED